VKQMATNNNHALFKLLFFALLIYTVSRTLKPAVNPYMAAGHYLLNYTQGFVMRGFIGTLLLPFFHLKTPTQIQTLLELTAYSIYLLSIFFITYFVFKFLSLKNNLFNKIICILFISSPFLIYQSIFFGYYDIILAVLLFIAILKIRNEHFGSAFALLILGTLIHEEFVFFLYPGILFIYLISEKFKLKYFVIFNIIFITFFVLLSANLFFDFEAYTKQQLYVGLHSPGLPGPLRNKKIIADVIKQTVFNIKNDPAIYGDMFRVNGPTVLFLMVVHYVMLSVTPFGINRVARFWAHLGVPSLSEKPFGIFLFKLISISAFFTPVSMFVIAFDYERAFSFAILTGFGFYQIFLIDYQLPRKHTLCLCPLGVLVIMYQVCCTIHPMFDRQSVLYPTQLNIWFGPQKAIALDDDVIARAIPIFPNSTFENGSLPGWKNEGQIAFKLETSADIGSSSDRVRLYGNFWLRATGEEGSLRSPEFIITGESIWFSITGPYKRIFWNFRFYDITPQTVELWVDGEKVAWTSADGSTDRAFKCWDTRRYKSRTAYIIVRSTGPAEPPLRLDHFVYLPDFSTRCCK